MTDWIETKSILLQAEDLSSHTQNIDCIREINKIMNEMASETQFQESSCKRLIKELSRDVEEISKSIVSPDSDDIFQTKRDSLGAERQNILNDISNSSRGIEQQRCELTKIRRSMESLATEHQQQVNEELINKHKRIARAISLYANITNVRWVYDTPKLTGFVTVKQTNEVKHFEFDQSTMDEFELANRLWALLETQY